MAIGYVEMSVGKAPATAKYKYIARQGKYAQNGKYEELRHVESANLPSWAAGATDFWRTIEQQEKTNQYREIKIALPVELDEGQREQLAAEFLAARFGSEHAYTYAIHENTGRLSGGENPHMHVIVCERLIDGRPEPNRDHYCRQRSGYSKDRRITGGKRKAWLTETKAMWEHMANQALERAGRMERVQMDNPNRRKTVHMGPEAAAMEARGIRTQKGDYNRRVEADNVVIRYLEEYAQTAPTNRRRAAEVLKKRLLTQSFAGAYRKWYDRICSADDPKAVADEFCRRQKFVSVRRESDRQRGNHR